jgi:RimJ/RimL family protein N-acetyltransferase
VTDAPAVRLAPWGPGDLELLRQCVGDPAMMVHLGGAESPEKLADRQRRYEAPGSNQYKIIDRASGEAAGWVGYWDHEWRGEPVFEIGWAVIPAFQGRGLAAAATAQAIELARREGTRRYLYAYPNVDNAASNAVCRRLGFTLLGETDYEYPKGHVMRCNDWRLDLAERAP